MIIKPKGCYDIYGENAKKLQYLNKVIDSLMEKYNYTLIQTPVFEASELFHRSIGDSTDVVSKETYDFKDRGDRSLTLRPEGTAGIVRSFIENKLYAEAVQPQKFYYNAPMYRYERPQLGRDREFIQFGTEVLGSNDPLIDAEVISIPVNLLKMLGLTNIKVRINSLGDKESRDKYRKAIYDYFKPHIDNLCSDCKVRIDKNPLRILDCKVDNDNPIFKKVPKANDYLNEESKTFFEEVKTYLEELEIDYEVESSLVRGLDYYNHTVFEIDGINPDNTTSVLGGGGRYNGLVDLLDGPETPAVGFACGLGRILNALEKNNIVLPINNKTEIFVMYVSDTEKKYAASLTQYLRINGFIVDTEYNGKNLKSQFKKADRLNSRYLILLNDEDLANDEIKIKNNVTKEEDLIKVEYLLYYFDEKFNALNESEEDYEEVQ